MSMVRRSILAGVAVLGVLAGVFLLSSAPALAAEGLGVTATFGTAGSGNDEFAGPAGVAVNQASHDVYVVDRGNNRVERFSSSGAYEAQFNGTEIDGAPAGAGHEAPAKFSEPRDIAIAPDGDVYVSDLGHGVIDKFSATGSWISQIASGFSGELLGVAVDSSGNLWVYTPKQVSEFDEAGTLVYQSGTGRQSGPAFAVDTEDTTYFINCCQVLFKFPFGAVEAQKTPIENVSALAVDLATNDLYVAQHTTLAQYGAFGEPFSEPLYRSGARSAMVGADGIAVNSTSLDVYVADSSENLVDIFHTGAIPAKPNTEKAEVKGPVVTLKGELLGGELGYYFAYNDNGGCEGGGQTPEGEETGTAVKESATISGGLEPNTQYMFCIVATNAYGQESGPPLPFTSEPVAPLVEAVSTPYVGVFEATIEATINPENDDTKCVVEYGETAPGETVVPCEPEDIGSGHGGQPASARLKGLTAGTTYHYRVVAENAAKLTSGPSEGTGEFTTAPEQDAVIEAESVSVETESGVGQREVTFTAQVNPELQPTTSCAVQYAKSGQSYGPPVPCEQSSAQIGDGSAAVTVEAKVAGLEAGADYHYRFVVENKTGTSPGADQVFGPPAVVTGGALEVPGVAPSTTATVGGEVNPESLDTRYYVQYGTSADEYAQSAPFLPPGIKLPQGLEAGSCSEPVVLGGESCPPGGKTPPDVSLEGLTPGATYRYRLVAYNADGTTYGAPMTVAVPPAPLVGPATLSEVTQSTATIVTSVNPEGLHTLYELDVGTSSAYGTPYPGDAGSGSAPVPLTFNLTGLEPGMTYHFRLTASNSDGESSEADQTFTTAATTPGALPVFSVPLSPPLLSFTGPAFPKESKTTTPKALTRAQKLAKALKACHKMKSKSKRAACQKQAKKRYGPLKKK